MNGEKGVIVIIAFLTFGIMLFLGAYFLSFAIAEFKIAKSQEFGTKTYYLSEAGIYQAIWKLRNDDEWSTCFVSSSLTYGCDCKNWSASFVRDTNRLIANSTTTVSIQNSSCGRGQITATSTVAFGQNVSQRVVKVTVFKASGALTEDAFLGDGNIETSQIAMNIYDGNLAAAGNITFKKQSAINIYNDPDSESQEGQVLAEGNVTISQSTLNASSTCSQNMCTKFCQGYVPGLTSCPPDEVVIPKVDFDSDDPGSYKSKAQAAESSGLCKALCNGVKCATKCIYTEREFDNLLLQVGGGGTLTLVHNQSGSLFSVYYIDGNFALRGKRNLVINGPLVIDANVSIGETRRWEGGSGASQIAVNDPGSGIPSGILAKGNIKFGKYASSATTRIKGLIYTLGNFELVSLPNLLELIGGKIAAGNFQLTSLSQGINIYLNSDIILEGIFGGPPGGGPADSPVIDVEHWEEAY